MGNLIKMDLYRMFRTKSFIVSNIIILISCILSAPLSLFMYNIEANFAETPVPPFDPTYDLSSILIEPLGNYMLLVVILISAVTFSYADIANGFIKNIAGQVNQKGHTVISKFFVLILHNIIFFLVGIIGQLISVLLIGGHFNADSKNIPIAIGTFFCKLLLLQALCAIILFISTGLKSKTFASVVGVILGSGSLMIVHMMIDRQVERFIHINLSDYDPSSLIMGGPNFLFANSVFVSIAVIAIFLPLTVTVFNKRDVT